MQDKVLCPLVPPLQVTAEIPLEKSYPDMVIFTVRISPS